MYPFADYHTHTRYSHGRGTPEENVQAASRRGLKRVAITDHGPGHYFIGIRGRSGFQKARNEIDSLKAKYPHMDILLGVEANVISRDGEIDVPPDIIPKLDLILVGYHLLVRTRDAAFFYHLNIKNRLSKYNLPGGRNVRDTNTGALIAAVRRYPVKIVTHPGLHVDVDTRALALACQEQGTALEINCSHLEETRSFVQPALATRVNFAISSDAHHPSEVGEFGPALKLVKDMAIPASRIINLSGVDSSPI